MTEAGIGWIALSTSILSAATFNSFAKALSPALSPLSLVFVSEVLVLAFVLLTFGAVPIMKTCAKLSRRDAMWLFILGCINGLIGPGLWFSGIALTSAVNASFFGKSEVVFLMAGAALILRERITKAHVLAMCTILAGMTVISLKGFTEGLQQINTGDMLIMGAAVAFATGSVLCRKNVRHLPPHILLGARSTTAVCGFFLISPFVPHTLTAELIALPAILIPALLGFGFISRFINSVAFYEALERLPVSTISLAASIDIVLGTLVAYAMLGEPLHWYHGLGGGFIILGTLLLELVGTHKKEQDLEHHMRQRHR